MQEARNNCFESKKRSTTLRQAKTGKHECRTLLLYFGTRAYLSSPEEGSCYMLSTRSNCCEFLASYGVIIQNVTQSFLKRTVCGASLTRSNIFYALKLISNMRIQQIIMHLYRPRHNFCLIYVISAFDEHYNINKKKTFPVINK